MPDVFILGYTKCATTSLYNQLTQHPDVAKVKRKEPHFHFAKIKGCDFVGPADQDSIAQMFITDPEQYYGLYPKDKISIDASAMSIEDPAIVDAINEEFPQAKYIIMVRDPVERAFSAYSHLLRDARETVSFRTAIEQEQHGDRQQHMPIWHNIASSRYVAAIQHARSLFGERLLVLHYQDYVKDNANTLAKVADFIGIHNGHEFAWQRQHANRSGLPKSKTLQKIIMRKSWLKTLFVRSLPETWVKQVKQQIMQKNTGEKPALSDTDRTYFQQLLASEKTLIKQDSPDRELLEALYHYE